MEGQKMNKSSISLLAQVLAAKDGLTIAEAERFIKQMFDVANESVQTDKLLKIKWLGTFKVTSVKDRESVNVNTGERIVIEGREKISFTPDNILKEIVNKPFAQFETVVVGDGVEFSDIDAKYEEETRIEDVAQEAKQQVESTTEPVQEVVKDTVSQGKGEAVETQSIESLPSDIGEDVVDVEAEAETVEKGPSTVVKEATDTTEKDASDTTEDNSIAPTEEDVTTTPEENATISKPQDYSNHNHHMIAIPKAVVFVALAVIVLLMAGMSWFAFSYGKMSAQRDHLASQLDKLNEYQVKPQIAREPKTPTSPIITVTAHDDSIKTAMREQKEQAKADSIRKAEQRLVQKAKADSIAKAKATLQQAENQPSVSTSYDSDVRIRTGAYRIVGVAQTVTVKKGQTLASLSKLYLGSGMECYVEAVNACRTVQEGQKVKIPKLELKKKLKK